MTVIRKGLACVCVCVLWIRELVGYYIMEDEDEERRWRRTKKTRAATTASATR